MDSITLADNVNNKQAQAHLQRVAANFIRENSHLSQKEINKALHEILTEEARHMGLSESINGPDPLDRAYKVDKKTWHERLDFYENLLKSKKHSPTLTAKIANRIKKINRRIKLDGKFRKGTNLFLRIALSVGRGAFQSVVAMNLNGLASKFDKLRTWKKADGIIKTWKDIGGKEKNFWKVVDYGKKRKKLFLTKKAKDRYIKKFGAINGICESDCICAEDSMNGPELAAIAAAAVPVIAALIPKIAAAFKSVGTPEADAEAQDVEKHGEDLANGTSGIPPVENAMLPGETQAPKVDTNNEAVEGIYKGEWKEALGPIVSGGFDTLIGLIKKKKPKWTKTVDKITQAGDDYVTGAYARQSGLKDFAYKAQKFGGISQSLLMFGGALALAVFALVGFRRGKK